MNIDVTTADTGVPCSRCGGPPLLTVKVPVPFVRVDGTSVTAYRNAPLCPRCDQDNPAARGALACFAVHGSITTREAVNQAAPVLREWIEHLKNNPPTYSDEEMEADLALWRASAM